MRFQKLQLNPVRNPGVLATGTWNRAAAFHLAALPDGQRVFIETGQGGDVLGKPLIAGKPFATSTKNAQDFIAIRWQARNQES